MKKPTPWLFALLAPVAFASGVGIAMLQNHFSGPVQMVDTKRATLHDSVQAHRWADSSALIEHGRNIERARGDSLVALLSARTTVWRTRMLPGRVDTLIARDTVRDSVLVAGADVRACLLVDTALIVRADSLAGELAQARYDADQCAEELRKRPATCNGWTAFGLGFGAGSALTTAACAVF